MDSTGSTVWDEKLIHDGQAPSTGSRVWDELITHRPDLVPPKE